MSMGALEPEPLGKADPRKIEFDQLLEMMHEWSSSAVNETAEIRLGTAPEFRLKSP
jgi:hypothetical protein